jgi:uncharacterized membrane protein YcaP (DUF421 family)
LAILIEEAVSMEWMMRDTRGRPMKLRLENLPVPLVMDGKVQDANLEKLGKTRFWLKNELQAQDVKDVKKVYLCTIDHRGRLFVNQKQPWVRPLS